VVLEEKAGVLHVVCEFNETAEPTRAAAGSGSKFGHRNGMTLCKPFSAIARCAPLICPTGKICSIFLTIASDTGLFRCQIACA
jgi:hypothetical protein